MRLPPRVSRTGRSSRWAAFCRSSGDSSIFDFALARYNPNGTLDTSFSGDGRKTTDFAGPDDGATGVAIQSDGKIVVVGRTGFGSPFGDTFDFALARYNSNGTLDTSFSGDGKQTASFGDSDVPTGVVVQGDGKIVAVGNTCNGNPDTTCDFALARFDFNGSLDTSFSGDGKQTADLGDIDIADATRSRETARSSRSAMSVKYKRAGLRARPIRLQRVAGHELLRRRKADDRVRELQRPSTWRGDPGGRQDRGRGQLGGADDFALARYNPNGSLDTSFSGDGKQTTDFGRL